MVDAWNNDLVGLQMITAIPIRYPISKRTDYCDQTTNSRYLHRASGPARIWDDGRYSWWLFNNVHRYYGPATHDPQHWWIHNDKLK